MASPLKFVSDFRAAVSKMIDDFDQVNNLCSMYAQMGWTVEDFAAVMPEGVTAEQFIAAVTACQGLDTGFSQLGQTLMRLKN